MHGLRQNLRNGLAVLLFIAATGASAAPPVLESDDDLGELLADELSDVFAELSSKWWNKDWQYRRKIEIPDPRLETFRPFVFLERPDTLLLFNTGRIARDGRDLRVVSADGQSLACGVLNFGHDDGTAALWFAAPDTWEGSPPFVTLYYGNPDADGVTPRVTPNRRAIFAERARLSLGREERRPGDGADPGTNADLLANLLVVEAETALDAAGNPICRNRKKCSPDFYYLEFPEASRGACIAAFKPWTNPELAEPVTAWTSAMLPRAGNWRVHVRFKTSEDPYHKSGPYQPFTLILGDEEINAGRDTGPGAVFRWESLDRTLPAGRLRVGFRIHGRSGPDCVLFTQNRDYRPDCRDVGGPLWMRFRVTDGTQYPFYIACDCNLNPYQYNVQRNPRYRFVRWQFLDRLFDVEENMEQYRRDADSEAFLQPNEWSPWMRTFDHGALSCHVSAHFLPRGHAHRYPGMNRLDVQYQVATRPHDTMLITEGTESMGAEHALVIRMPTRPTLQNARDTVMTYGQWADVREAEIAQMGYDVGQGPKRIRVLTDSYIKVEKDIESVLNCCARLGFNGIELQTRLMPETEWWALAREKGFSWSSVHHIALASGLDRLQDVEPDGSPWEQLTRAHELAFTDRIRGYLERTPVELVRSKYLINLADEPGPRPHYLFINLIPALKAAFHDFLREEGLSPEFFGKSDWAAVEATGFLSRFDPRSELGETLRSMGVDINAIAVHDTATEPSADVNAEPGEIVDTEVGDASILPSIHVAEERRQIDVRLVKPGQGTGLNAYEKRLYHWTQMFRNRTTQLAYGTCARLVPPLYNAKAGREQPYRLSPNFQAMPMMACQMWDGALNLFSWARSRTTNFLLMEDWINDPYRVAFGFRLMEAAARKHGQERGFLIVGNRYEKTRYLTALALGSRLFHSYSYGLLRVKGPAWAGSSQLVHDWGQVLRWTRAIEDQLLASRNRPCPVALLVANTSEINTPFFNANAVAGPHCRMPGRALFQRAAIFRALTDAGIPVEIVGEAELLEDDALSRYIALYVVDTHVHSRVQQRIREWVEDGGVLWGSYSALARKEYDEPCILLNDVFGLADRGSLPEPGDADKNSGYAVTVPGNDVLPSQRFTGMTWQPRWNVSTAGVLATFDNGNPAIVQNRFGTGQAILVGCTAYPFSSGFQSETTQDSRNSESMSAIAELAFALANGQSHVQLNQSGLMTIVRDGPGFSLLFLINASGMDKVDVRAGLQLQTDAAPPVHVTDVEGHSPVFEQQGHKLTMAVGDIPDNDARIFIIEHDTAVKRE